MTTKVSLGFTRLSDNDLDNFAQSVIDSMTGNASYPTPPVTMTALQAAKDDLSAKLARAKTGGPPDTAAKNASRDTLENLLRQDAMYVQMMCANDMSVLLSSGFKASNFSNAQTPLTKPEAMSIKNGSSGQLIIRIDPVANARQYEARARPANSELWGASAFAGDSQHITLNGLTRGTDYVVQVRALGGSTGQSDWSDPSTHMAM
jgi:hypothetical protein